MPTTAMMLSGGGGGGGGGASTPSAIFGTDLVAWYKLGTAVYDQIAGGNLLTAGSTDGTEVGRWEDQSGNGYHMTRGTTIAVGHMTWRTAVTNRGAPTISLPSSGSWFAVPNALGTALSGAGVGAMFVNLKEEVNNSQGGSWSFGSSGTEALYTWSDSHIYESFGSTNRFDTGATIIETSSAFHRYAVYSATNDFANYLNNTQQFSTATNTVGFRTTGITFGASAGGRNANFYVSELVLVKVKPTSTQLSNMDTYLST